MLMARILADAERQAHGDAESLAAAQERDVNGPLPRAAIVASELEGFVGSGSIVAAAQTEHQFPAGKAIEHAVGIIDDLPFGLPHQVPLESVAAQQLGQKLVAV